MLNIFANFRSHFEYRRFFSNLVLVFVFGFGFAFTACSTNDDIDMSGWTFTVFNTRISVAEFSSSFGTPPTPVLEFPINIAFGTKSKYEMFAYLDSYPSVTKAADVPYEYINTALEYNVGLYINSAQKQQILDKLASDEYVVVGMIDVDTGKVAILAYFKQ